MARPVISLCLLSLLLCSVGCRMCNTPHDYRVAGYINRCDDYRGYNPLYRAGSILGGHDCKSCRTVIGDAYYADDASNFYTNAGNYGNTTPVTRLQRTPDKLDSRPRKDPIAIPLLEPGVGGMTEPPRSGTDTIFPDIQELLNQPRGTSSSPTIPLVPPGRQRISPPALDDTPTETIPFSPSDEIFVPQDPFPTTTDMDVPITLEELRRLDPSVRDLQIISIEDAAVEAAAR